MLTLLFIVHLQYLIMIFFDKILYIYIYIYIYIYNYMSVEDE